MKKTKKMAGYSFMEILISMAIFSLITITVVSLFAASYRSQKKSKDIQQKMEDSRVAIEMMAKNIRMGTIDSASGSQNNISFYNYSQNKCVYYGISDDNKIEMGEILGSRQSLPSCSGLVYPLSDLIAGGFVEGLKFDIIKSNQNPVSLVVGKVTISIKLLNSADLVQTTVSLRDYVD